MMEIEVMIDLSHFILQSHNIGRYQHITIDNVGIPVSVVDQYHPTPRVEVL
jgi:hypothetical protein